MGFIKDYEIEARIQKLENFLRWPSIDNNNEPMELWITQLAGSAFREHQKNLHKDDTRDILLALIDHLGLEYSHNKVVIKKKKGKK